MTQTDNPPASAPTPHRPAGGPRTARPRPKRGEGQWALGYREPLNANEQFKKDDNPLNVRARIENIYAHRGFGSIDPQDLRGRFRWWGLYTQRKAGIDGGRTAVLEPHELEDEYFMLRIRIDGGELNLAQLRTVAGISTEFARDSADITDRQNIQLHWIRIEDVPEIWRRLDAVGLQTTEACGDCPRVVLGAMWGVPPGIVGATNAHGHPGGSRHQCQETAGASCAPEKRSGGVRKPDTLRCGRGRSRRGDEPRSGGQLQRSCA